MNGATIPTGCGSGCSARRTRPSSGLYARRRMELFGATRDDFARGEGEERAARARQPVRALQEGGLGRRRAQRADRLRPAGPPRHLRDERRRRRARRVVPRVRAASRRQPTPCASAASRPSRRATRRRRSSSRTSRPTARPVPGGMPEHGFKESIAVRAYDEAGSAPTISIAPRSTTSRPRWSSTGTSRSACARPARPRSCCATVRRRWADASRSTRAVGSRASAKPCPPRPSPRCAS